jgi:hypothetical protein
VRVSSGPALAMISGSSSTTTVLNTNELSNPRIRGYNTARFPINSSSSATGCCALDQFTSSAISAYKPTIDTQIFSKEIKEIERVKKFSSQEFEMRDLGQLTYFLGIQVMRDRNKGTITLGQS